jgi:hypothetical protein
VRAGALATTGIDAILFHPPPGASAARLAKATFAEKFFRSPHIWQIFSSRPRQIPENARTLGIE